VKTIDELASDGVISGVIDLAMNDITGHIFHGYMSAPPDRYTRVYASGIPVVSVPGGTDIILKGPVESLSEEYRTRPYVIHNPYYTHVRASKPEMAEVGISIAKRLQQCKGNNTMLIPQHGFSQLNRDGEVLFDEEGNEAFIAAMRKNIGGKTVLRIIEAHINDAAFAGTVAEEILTLMGTKSRNNAQ
jgi:uncharacterized protein (UPF0261 family)